MRLVHIFSPFEEICVLFDSAERPLEFSVWKEDELQTEAIYSAQAVCQVPSGWFLDLGKGKTAYINMPSVYLKPDGKLCRSPLTQGDRLLVQIIRPEIREKEAEASHKIGLAGKNVVLMPTQQAPSFSRQLDQEQKERLLSSFPQEGVLFRTLAGKTDVRDIRKEVEFLKQKWSDILSKAEKNGELYTPQKDVFRYASSYSTDLKEIVTNDAKTAAALKASGLPVTFEGRGLWNKERLDEALDEIKATKTLLPSGGFLMTEQTSACVCFDVNAGAGKASTANEEACSEILRQIRLKGLGGQMVVDFAGRKDENTMKRLIGGLKRDNVFISGVSTLGLVELTVKKTRASVFDVFSCPEKRQAARIVLKLWDAVSVSKPVVSASPVVLSYVRPFLKQLEQRLGTQTELCFSQTEKVEGTDD